MEKEVKLPSVSEDAGTATVAEIHVKEGDTVEEGQDLIAVDSDKASVDVPSDAAGKVKAIKVSTGDEVSPGDVIIVLETEEGDASDEEGDSGSEGEKEGSSKGNKKESKEEKSEDQDGSGSEEGDEEDEESEDQPDKEKNGPGEDEDKDKAGKEDKKKSVEKDKKGVDSHEAPSAPLAKKFARELGIDINDLAKDDPQKRVTREDVMAYAKKLIQQVGQTGKAPATEGGVKPIRLPDFSQWGEFDKEPLDGIRTRIGENTTLSWQNIPHVTQHDKADMTEMMEFRQKLADKDQKISITALLVKISAEALKHFPRFNSSIDLANREVYLKKYYHISVAVDTDSGLLMPVIKDVDRKSVQDLSKELAEMAEKARNRKLKGDEMKGGNFAISNLGGIGGTSFTPVIFPPQVAILGVSAPQTEAVFNGEEWEPRDFMPLSLSYDHRAIDGAGAARFLRWICEVIEQPFNLL